MIWRRKKTDPGTTPQNRAEVEKVRAKTRKDLRDVRSRDGEIDELTRELKRAREGNDFARMIRESLGGTP